MLNGPNQPFESASSIAIAIGNSFAFVAYLASNAISLFGSFSSADDGISFSSISNAGSFSSYTATFV